MTILSTIVCFLGLVGTRQVSVGLMFLHSFFCCSILGAFFCYLLLDMFFKESTEKDSLTDTTVMIILSLPYLVIFLIGCHSMYLTNMIYDEIK